MKRLGARWAIWVTIVAVLIGLLLAPRSGAWVPVAILGPIVFSFLWMRLTVSARGVEVAFGPWNWPTKRVPLDKITGARVETVNPLRFGGWGYRVKRGVRAIIVKGGPALWVEVDGPDLVVTMDRPEDAAGIINALVRARGPSSTVS